jgi:hypothetical protein
MEGEGAGGLFALAARLHGGLGLLALALLLHPVVGLRRPGPPSPASRLAAALAGGITLLVAVFGAVLYPTYRAGIKPGLVRDALPLAQWFESKEHIGFFAAALAVGAAGLLLSAPRSSAARRGARWMFGLAALCAAITAALGVWVAAFAHPAF